MLADSSTGSGLYLQYGGVFLLGSLHCVAVCELFLPAGCVSRYADSHSDEHPAITCSIVSPTLSHFLHVGHFQS